MDIQIKKSHEKLLPCLFLECLELNGLDRKTVHEGCGSSKVGIHTMGWGDFRRETVDVEILDGRDFRQAVSHWAFLASWPTLQADQ